MSVGKLLRRLGPVGLGSAAGLLLVTVAALCAPLLTRTSPVVGAMGQRLLPPLSPGHLAGTDPLGRDILTRIVYGTRVSLEVGLGSVALAGAVGCAVGVVSGYAGTWLDAVVMRLVDVQLSFPFIVLAITVAGILGPSLRNVIITLVLSRWVVYCRLVRGEVLRERESLYVTAAQAAGASPARTLLRHVLPNVLPTVVVLASLEFGRMILSEAAISFLGFGIQPPQPALGTMVAEGRNYLFSAWWVSTIPGAAVLIIGLLANLLGDALHDALERR
jgi:peptide/nickel transport system permease protein